MSSRIQFQSAPQRSTSGEETGKRFLRRIYGEWRDRLASALPEGAGAVLELGAGDLWMEPITAESIRADVRELAGLSLRADARALPVREASLRLIGMTDVFHHIPDAAAFLREAARALRPGGVVAMVEPWKTPWSSLIYRTLHHEPFEPDAPAWQFVQGDPMLAANSALPWIVFERDRARFEREHPALRIERIEPFMPLRYLLSGGVTFSSLQPGWMFPFWTGMEKALAPLSRRSAMFAFIVLRRV